MSPFWIAIVAMFVGGNPIDVEVMPANFATEQACKSAMTEILQKHQKEVDPDTQVSIKCVDFTQLPLTISLFGTKGQLTTNR